MDQILHKRPKRMDPKKYGSIRNKLEHVLACHIVIVQTWYHINKTRACLEAD